jgi:hypothetical protein
VIGRQAPRQNLDPGVATALGDQLHVPREIIQPEEHLLPPVATLRDMMWNAGNNDASGAGHLQSIARTTEQYKNIFRTMRFSDRCLENWKIGKWGQSPVSLSDLSFGYGDE